ncbi:hypothetical protein TgHK011_008642 [Trichoderma gracile]|nr:hypothetical protein TgHK011_008642 [Trichoderma gracile]
MSCPARLSRRTPKRSVELAQQSNSGCYHTKCKTPDRLRAAALFASPARCCIPHNVRRSIFSVLPQPYNKLVMLLLSSLSAGSGDGSKRRRETHRQQGGHVTLGWSRHGERPSRPNPRTGATLQKSP